MFEQINTGKMLISATTHVLFEGVGLLKKSQSRKTRASVYDDTLMNNFAGSRCAHCDHGRSYMK